MAVSTACNLLSQPSWVSETALLTISPNFSIALQFEPHRIVLVGGSLAFIIHYNFHGFGGFIL